MDQRTREATRPVQGDALSLFAVMWALASTWHLLGNTTVAPAWAQACLAVGVGLVLLRPGAPLPLGLLALAGLVTVWTEAPTLGNHWLLAGAVNLVIVAAVVTGVVRRRPHDRADLANRLLPPARLCLLGFYGFAAFAKLNSAFLDPEVSCAVFFFRESTDSVGLTGLQLGGAAWVEHLVMYLTLGVELLVPVLLLGARTRRFGVLLALVFHALLAIDHAHQFFDFSAVLYALFVLFLPAEAGHWVAERIGSIRARLALLGPWLPQRVHLLLVGVVTATALLVAVDVFTRPGALVTGWWPWQLYAMVTVASVANYLRQGRPSVAHVRLAPHHALFVIVPLLVVFNGLTPYLELKTGFGWNMYSNLRTVDGDTNHLLLPQTLPLTSEQAGLVEIVDTNSAALARYAATDYALTWRQLRTYLADHPGVRITYRRDGQLVELDRAGDDPDLVAPVPSWREKVQLFRAVDLSQPERCLTAFGPAH